MGVAELTKRLGEAKPDMTRFLVPESFTPFYFTPIYHEFTRAEKLRYNQLFGLVYNEQFVFYESTLSRYLLTPVLENNRYASLHGIIREFRADEMQHAELFSTLNRCIDPILYANSNLNFIQLPAAVHAMWRFFAGRPEWFPFILWLIAVLEERAAYLSRGIIKERDRLEPLMVEVYQAHLADESNHFDYDEALLDRFWYDNRSWVRSVNAWIFQHVFTEYFTTPKRTALRVVDKWLEAFPHWCSRRQELHDALCKLDDDSDYIKSLYGPDVIPNARSQLAAQPEFQRRQSLLCLLGIC